MEGKIKAQIIVPIIEFGNITYFVEGTAEEINEYATYLLSLRKSRAGLSDKEFNACLDRFLTDGTGETETYLRMNPEQQAIIQAVKKGFNRIDYKNTK